MFLPRSLSNVSCSPLPSHGKRSKPQIPRLSSFIPAHLCRLFSFGPWPAILPLICPQLNAIPAICSLGLSSCCHGLTPAYCVLCTYLLVIPRHAPRTLEPAQTDKGMDKGIDEPNRRRQGMHSRVPSLSVWHHFLGSRRNDPSLEFCSSCSCWQVQQNRKVHPGIEVSRGHQTLKHLAEPFKQTITPAGGIPRCPLSDCQTWWLVWSPLSLFGIASSQRAPS